MRHLDLESANNTGDRSKCFRWLLILGIVAALFLSFAVGSAYYHVSFLMKAQSATGRVLHITVKPQGDYSLYTPRISYQVNDKFFMLQPEADVVANYQVGEWVKVWYQKNDPAKAQTNRVVFDWSTSLTCTFFALLFCVMAAYYFYRWRKLS